jgi:hypothetical protein
MLGIIDVREWQSVVDLATAKPIERKTDFLEPLQNLAKKFPYPGDLENAGIKWVMDAAGEIVNHYQPGWLFLSFTQPYFNSVYNPLPLEKRKDTAKFILDNIMAFARRHGFRPLIISTGSLVPLQGPLLLPKLKGSLQASPWSHFMAGVFKSEREDEELLNQEPHIRKIIRREDFINAYKITDPFYSKNLPDYLLIAEDGWNFKGIYSNNRVLHNIEKYNLSLPVYSEIGPPDHIEGIHSLMEKALGRGEKVLLAYVEGLDEEDFVLPWQPVNNVRDWYAYTSYNLYYVLATGKPFYLHPLPPVYDHSIKRPLPLRYPMSGPARGTVCEDSLGHKAGVPTAAVGSRSMITHSIINADLTMECYTRAQANMGVLVAVNEERYIANLQPR